VDLVPGQRCPVGLGLGPVENGLGRSEVVFPHDWNAVDRSVTGFMTITAAKGDEVHASVTGTSISNAIDRRPHREGPEQLRVGRVRRHLEGSDQLPARPMTKASSVLDRPALRSSPAS
jgi:hypothetical protein